MNVWHTTTKGASATAAGSLARLGCRYRRLPGRGVLAAALLAGSCAAFAQEADLQLFVSGPPSVTEGFATSVSGFLFNVGPDTASNAVLTITASDGLQIDSVISGVGSCTVSGQVATCQLGHLAAGPGVGFDAFVLAVGPPGSNGLTTLLTSDTPDPSSNVVSSSLAVLSGEPDAPLAGARLFGSDPIDTYSRSYLVEEAPDLNLRGLLPVFFQRFYSSVLVEDGVVQSALGPNWQHNYDLRLAVSGTNATVGFRRGRLIQFAQNGTNWVLNGRTDVPFRLVESDGGFILGDPRSQLMYFFDAGGLLVRIEDGRGNTNFLTYSGTLLTNVSDGLGRSLSLSYNANNLLTNVSDGLRSVQFVQGSSNLASVVDALGNLTTYSYTTNTNNPALMTARTLPEGNTPVTQVYDAGGRVSSQTDALTNTTLLSSAPGLGTRDTTLTNPLGHTQVHSYDERSQLNAVVDEAGKVISFGVDAAGRRNLIIDRLNNQTRIFYENTNGFPNRIDLAANPDQFFAYSPRVVNGITFFDLTRVSHPDNTTNLYAFDAQGNLTNETNRVGDVWTYGRNARGQLLSVTNPLGGTAAFAYDAAERLASSTDSDIGVTTYEYDALHRLTNLTHPNPDTVQFVYDALDRLTVVTDERTNTTAFQYDGNSRLTNIVDALGQVIRYEYDAVDRLVRAVDRLGNPTGFGYDARSLLSSVTNRNGFVTRLVYDSRQRLTGVVDPAGVTNLLGYDDEGLLTAITNPLGETLRFQRDPMGYVTNLIDPVGNRVSLTRDSMKRVTGVTDALNRQTAFNFDRRGLLTNATQEAGISASYRFNPLGLLTNFTDPKGSQWTFAYTLVGRMTNFTDPLGRATAYAYDVRGRPARMVYPDGVTQTNTYDGANNVIQMAWSDGTLFQFAYDPLNRLTNATGSDPIAFSYDAEDRVTHTRQVGLDFGAGYDADGQLTSVSYSNGLCTVTYVYDSRDRLIHVSDTLTGQGMGFSYDDADRLTGVIRSNGVNGTYTYDARGFLTRIQEGSILDLQYTGDAAGQVAEADYVVVPIDPVSALTNEQAAFTHDPASQISSAGYQYDPRGRLTNAPNTAFLWDGASRLIGIDAVNLGYNALGNVVTRAEGGNTNRYFYNYAIGLNPIMAERNDNTGQFMRFYVWSPDGLLLYLINLPGNTVSYPLFDYTRSTLALTDGGGAVTDAYAYDLYGRLLAQTGTNAQPFRFVGQPGVRHEPAGSLYHMRARYYDPQSARFLSKEPIWPSLQNPKKLNPYQYAQADPVSRIDRTGTEDEPARPKWEHGIDMLPPMPDDLRAEADLIYDWLRWLRFTKKNKPFTKKAAEKLEEEILDKFLRAALGSRFAAKQADRAIDAWLKKARKWERWMKSQQPTQGSTIGPPVSPESPKAPETQGTAEEYGFLFTGGDGGVSVSYGPPDDSYATPLSDSVYSKIWNGNGSITHLTEDVFAQPYYNGMSGGFDHSWSILNDGGLGRGGYPIRNPKTGMMEWMDEIR